MWTLFDMHKKLSCPSGTIVGKEWFGVKTVSYHRFFPHKISLSSKRGLKNMFLFSFFPYFQTSTLHKLLSAACRECEVDIFTDDIRKIYGLHKILFESISKNDYLTQ